MKVIQTNNKEFLVKIDFGNGTILDFTRDAIKELAQKLNEIGGQIEPLVMQQNGGSCKWRLGDTMNDKYYVTECGNAFEFNSGDYTHNHFTHCPYCGKPIAEDVIENEE